MKHQTPIGGCMTQRQRLQICSLFYTNNHVMAFRKKLLWFNVPIAFSLKQPQGKTNITNIQQPNDDILTISLSDFRQNDLIKPHTGPRQHFNRDILTLYIFSTQSNFIPLRYSFFLQLTKILIHIWQIQYNLLKYLKSETTVSYS